MCHCSEQLWVLDQILGMVRNTHLPRAGDWLVSCAVFLMGHAHFNIANHQSPDKVQTGRNHSLLSLSIYIYMLQTNYKLELF